MTLALWLRRTAFDDIVQQAVPASFEPAVYPDERAWKRAVSLSPVRLQWDPDLTPDGGRVERRAIQLGLRGEVLARYARDWIIDIEDLSAHVAEQRSLAQVHEYARLSTPRETVHHVRNPETATRLGVSRIDIL